MLLLIVVLLESLPLYAVDGAGDGAGNIDNATSPLTGNITAPEAIKP